MEKKFDSTVTMEGKARFSFLERYEGFCVDLIKVIMCSSYVSILKLIILGTV